MPQRVRRAKPTTTPSSSPTKSKSKSVPIRKKPSTKKTSPTKRLLESSATVSNPPRQKRLSSLTAAALVHYCTSLLSPSRKSSRKNSKSSERQRRISNVSLRSDTKTNPTESHTRTRREASARASAMIMQQNEIERSRRTYTSTSGLRRHPTKSTIANKDDHPVEQPAPEPVKFNIPSIPPVPVSIPSMTNVSNQSEYPQSSNVTRTKSTHPDTSMPPTYAALTETILAEHNRLYESQLPSHTNKRDQIMKWTQDVALSARLSSSELPVNTTGSQSSVPKPSINDKERSTSSLTESMLSNHSSPSCPMPKNVTTPSFVFPSSGYPVDMRSFYSLVPCWQYPGKPHQ